MPWTDDMIESLKKMWDEGLSTGEIGRRLGVSKNSIVGKVHRLKLSGRPSPIKKKGETAAVTTKTSSNEKSIEKSSAKSSKSPASSAPASVQPATPKVSVSKPGKTEKSPSTVTAPLSKPTMPVKSLPEKDSEVFMNISIPTITKPRNPGDKVMLTDLDNHTCRWPIGDPKDENFHFCGASVRVGQTYCEEHAAIAYVKNFKK